MNRSGARLPLVAASALAAIVALLAACAGSMSGPSGMGFFVSSTGSGRGGDLGGLAGADRLCTSLATAAGAGNRTWRAYLSVVPVPGSAAPSTRATASAPGRGATSTASSWRRT